MKRSALAAFLILVCASSLRAAPYRVLTWDEGSITVEFVTGEPLIIPLDDEGSRPMSTIHLPGYFSLRREGRPILPIRRFLFEVPSPRTHVEILERDVVPIEGTLPEVFFTSGGSRDRQRRVLDGWDQEKDGGFVRFAGVGLHRRRYLAQVDLFPIILSAGADKLLHARRLVIRLTFPPARVAERKAAAVRPIDHLIVNREQAALWRGWDGERAPSQRTPFEFARSTNWIRIGVESRGVYLITYSDLMNAGVDPHIIDPTTLRLFSGGPVQQPDSVPHGGSFLSDYRLTEHAITYRGSSVWEGDSIIFYGVGTEGWRDDIDPDASRTERYEHLYATENVYWLTWGGSFQGQPKRMAERTVQPIPGPGPVVDVTSYEERLHVEEDVLYDPIYTDDRWYWRRLLEGSTASFTHSFILSHIASADGMVRAIGYGPFQSGQNNDNSAVFSLNGTEIETLSWHVRSYYVPEAMEILEQPVTNLQNGTNSFNIQLNYQSDNDKTEQMYVLWYEIFYTRQLMATAGFLDFHGPEGANYYIYTAGGFPAGEILLLHVTHHEEPVILTGFQRSGGDLIFGDEFREGGNHYLAVSVSQLQQPALDDVRAVPSLRDELPPPHMIIVYHDRFQSAAQTIREHRAAKLPYADNPVVKAIDVRDVYNNFSGGMKDPIAIRNYLKFLYDNFTEGGEPVIRYALLIGNGTYDPKDILDKGLDLVPYYFNIRYINENEGIEDEDFLTKLDDYILWIDRDGDGQPDTIPDVMPDVAIGRMSVLSEREANAWIDRIVHYEGKHELGPWVNKLIFVADDEYSTGRNIDFYFMHDAEEICSRDGPLPGYFDKKKVYLHHYPFVGDMKTGARNDLLKEWSDGALLVNYAGHGSPKQMADERVMLNSDIYSLTNGPRRPFFLVFSCSVGDLESPYQRSMGQNLVTFDGGGAIGTICAVAPTIGFPNDDLNNSIFEKLFTSKDSTGSEPVGYALQLAKIETYYYERNNSKFALLSDPALKLAIPDYIVEHDIASIDTMEKGHRYNVDGTVMFGGQVFTGYNGVAEVIVQEAEERIDKWVVRDNSNWHVRYSLPGNILFKGMVEVTAGRFSVDFVVPKRCRTGSTARLRSYVTSTSTDAVGACDTLTIVASDSIPINTGAPEIRMYFSGQATRVKPGARLIAEISDPDGIAILGADPQSSIFLDFDSSGYPIFVTDYFNYDFGSSSMGRIEYPLHSDFEPGKHTVVIRAFDNLGASSSDTLTFEIVEERVYTVDDVFNFPNPFSESTNFVFQLSSEADVTLRIYTLSGVVVWAAVMAGSEGFNSIYWDGRDLAGDRLANGTYLYLLEVDFRKSLDPEETVNREERIEGKVVLLR
ncbi:MAG: type IX secretion system sortase PorU [bacterium]|nr:MAG: type IX secretion system sortase PorU [bacterium]